MKLRQHTIKCIMEQDFEASDNLGRGTENQSTEDKDDHSNDKFSFMQSIAFQENEVNEVENKHVSKGHLEQEENDDADSLNAMFSFEDLQNGSDTLERNLCEKVLEIKEEADDQISDVKIEYFFEPDVETDGDNEAIDKQFQCEQCKKIFHKRSSLMYHVKMVHAVNPGVCDVCCKTFANRKYLKRHMSSVHRTEKDANSGNGTGNDYLELKCPMCPKSYLKKYSLREHIRTFHTKEESVCDFCSKVFQNRKYLQNHIRKVHSATNELYECEECNKQFQSKLSRTEHIRQVHVINLVSCGTCGKEFKNKTMLGKHVQNIHGGTKSEDLASSKKEINYMRRLLEREKLECNQCSKVFEKNIYLKRHIRSVHSTSDTLFPCEHCGKEFINTERRGIHINMVHVINEVSCEVCGKVYKNKTMLGKHARRSKSCYVIDRKLELHVTKNTTNNITLHEDQ